MDARVGKAAARWCPSWGGLFAGLLAMTVAAPVMAQVEFPRMELNAGMFRIDAEVAHTDAARQQGLMGRQAMRPEQGMLFVFPVAAQHCMWMKNTLLPLSVAFLDQEGRIINVADMKPQSLDSHCAARPASYALEMNAGWFAGRKMGPGWRIGGLERAPQPR